MELIDLYRKSLSKWENILVEFDKYGMDSCRNFYINYCLKSCAFCDDSRVSGRCRINKTICDCDEILKNSLMMEGRCVTDKEVFRGWILDMIASLKTEITLLEA